MLNGDTIERLKTEKIDSSNGSVEEMPKKKKTLESKGLTSTGSQRKTVFS